MNDETFRRLAESAPALLAAFDDAGNFRWANASWTRELGWATELLTGTNIRSLIHADDAPAFIAALASASQAPPSLTHRTRFRHAEAGWEWIDWFVRSMHDGLFYARNVTPLLRTERSSERMIRLLSLTEEVAGVGQWSIDLEHERVSWSPQVFRIHGLPVSESAPSLVDAMAAYHPDDRQRVADVVAGAAGRGEPFEFELRLLRADGEVRNVLALGRCEMDPLTGRTQTIFGTFQDVTNRDRMRDRLAREQRLVSTGMLAAGVGHEMNNPLTYVIMNLDVVAEELHLLAGASPSGRLRHVIAGVEQAQTAAGRLKTIVRGLRAFARQDAPPAPMPVAPTIELAINMAMHDIRLSATCMTELTEVPLVLADDSRLTQVLVNLLCNAAQSFRESAPDRNRIVVRCESVSDGRVAIRVSDNGSGIDPGVMQRIFEPFFTTKLPGEGTGLGLAISQNIVEGFGGELRCDTELGRGTTFTVLLNVATEPSGEGDDDDSGAVSVSTGRVVIVDDELDLGRMLKRVLSTECQVEWFSDPREAMDWLLRAPPTDLVLCDLSMPYISGKVLYETVRAARPALAERFVFMSGGATSDELTVFLNTVVNERFDKPFNLPNLRALVRRIVGRREPA